MTDVTGELERLADLRERGVLTQEEFDHQKALLLQPQAPAAPVIPAQEYRAAPYAPPATSNKLLLLVAVGLLALIIVGVGLWATGILKLPSANGTSSSTLSTTSFSSNASVPAAAPTMAAAPSPPPAAAPTVAATADDSWLMGQWENVATPPCTQWLRFGTDHTLGDNGNNTGTWSLATGADGSFTLSMNVTGDQLRQGVITRDAAAGTMSMGSGATAVTWRKTTC